MPEFNFEQAQAFSQQMLQTLNKGALCLMISIGHRTGLFDSLKTSKPATSTEIAANTGLNERYVREWLGAMTSARIVILDSGTMRYSLPAEHAAFLTRAAGADNMAVFAQYIAVLGSVENDIVECFHKGGGVPYSKFPRFHDVMAEDSGQSVLSSLESHVLPLVPSLSDRLSRGLQMLDVGCGRGKIIIRLAELFPRSEFTGFDLSEEAIAHAQNAATEKKLKNVSFQVADLSDFDDSAPVEKYDVISTFDAIHDQARPLKVLRGIFRALKPDGIYLMQDIRSSSYPQNNIEHPIGPFLYTVSCMHCMTVSLAQDGDGVGAMWGEEMTRDYLRRAGFQSIETHQMSHDIQNNWYVIGK